MAVAVVEGGKREEEEDCVIRGPVNERGRLSDLIGILSISLSPALRSVYQDLLSGIIA
jgi:hypothetical protein